MSDGMMAETTTIKGHGGDEIEAYFARPLGDGPYPGVVVVHHRTSRRRGGLLALRRRHG